MRARLHFAWLAVCCAAAALSALAPLAVAEPTSRAPGVRGLDAAPGRALAREADRPPGALPGDGGPEHGHFPAAEVDDSLQSSASRQGPSPRLHELPRPSGEQQAQRGPIAARAVSLRLVPRHASPRSRRGDGRYHAARLAVRLLPPGLRPGKAGARGASRARGAFTQVRPRGTRGAQHRLRSVSRCGAKPRARDARPVAPHAGLPALSR